MTTTEGAAGSQLAMLAAAGALLCGTVGCARPPIGAPSVARPTDVPLHRGPVEDFASAAGLRWLVLAKPRAAMADPELAAAILQIIPAQRFVAFERASGVDLRELPRAAVASYPYSTLYLAELPSESAHRARAAFMDRLVSGATVKRPRPGLLRIGGVIGQTPETLVTIEERALAISVGDPLQATIVGAYAEGRLKNSPPALRGAALSSLPSRLTDELAVLYAAGPFADEWQQAAGGLLQSTVSLAISVRRVTSGKVAIMVCLSGAWGDSAPAAAERLSEAWKIIAESPTGRLFELPRMAEAESSPDLLTLRFDLELAPLVRGLKASVLGDVSEILRLPARNTQTTIRASGASTKPEP